MPRTTLDGRRSYEMQGVSQAFGLINILLSIRSGLTLTQLAQRMDMSKNKMFRLLSTLEQHGIVEKLRNSRYQLALTAFCTARRVLASRSPQDHARPIMDELAERFDEAVYLGGIHEGKAFLYDMAECRQAIRVSSFIGSSVGISTVPMEYASGEVRVDTGGLDAEITTVSATFSDSVNPLVGALIVLAPAFRMPMERVDTEVAPHLCAAAQLISLKLGATEIHRTSSESNQSTGYPCNLSQLPAMKSWRYRNNESQR
jgi:DNA-binding IclR family transcriptional regulator